LATQSLGTDRSWATVLQGGAPDIVYYTHDRVVKTGVTTSVPGSLLSGNGENEGEVDLAATGDGAASYIDIMLQEVGVATQDIDTALAAGDFLISLRQSGGRFLVGQVTADQSSDSALGYPLVTEATGHSQRFVYGDTAAATDTLIEWVGRVAEVVVDVASTDLACLIYF
jgi:hypothetical protein